MSAIKKIKTKISNSEIWKPATGGALTLLLLDSSGSMHDHGQYPLIAANECLEVMQSNPGADKTLTGIWTFSDKVRNDVPVQPLLGIKPLQEYKAKGGTALYDAVGDALHMGLELKEFAQKTGIDISVALSVITDGLDQHSTHPQARVLTFSKHAIEAGFDLSAIGIGIDHNNLAELLGFKPGNCHTVEASVSGIRQATEFTSITFTRTMVGAGWEDNSPPPSSHQ